MAMIPEMGNIVCIGRDGTNKVYGDVDDGIYQHSLLFSFLYNGMEVNKIYVSTNLYIGFGSDAKHLQVCQRDGRSYGIYVEEDNEKCRIRFEGRSIYNGNSSTDTTYELTIHQSGLMLLAIEKTPRNGTDAFESLGGTGASEWHTGKSYVFEPGEEGKNWTIYSEYHINYNPIKSLIKDTDGLKRYNYEIKQWELIEETVVTEEVIKNKGHYGTIPSLEGISVSNPIIYSYLAEIGKIPINVSFIGIPQYIELKQTDDYVIATSIKGFEFDVTVPTGSILKMIVSVDSGNTWYAYHEASWQQINYNNAESIKRGNTHIEISAILHGAWRELLQESMLLRFAYYIEGRELIDFPILNRIRINYE